jgi:hypothetical protein
LRHDPHPKKDAEDNEYSDGKENGVSANNFGQHARDLLKRTSGNMAFWRGSRKGRAWTGASWLRIMRHACPLPRLSDHL